MEESYGGRKEGIYFLILCAVNFMKNHVEIGSFHLFNISTQILWEKKKRLIQ